MLRKISCVAKYFFVCIVLDPEYVNFYVYDKTGRKLSMKNKKYIIQIRILQVR